MNVDYRRELDISTKCNLIFVSILLGKFVLIATMDVYLFFALLIFTSYTNGNLIKSISVTSNRSNYGRYVSNCKIKHLHHTKLYEVLNDNNISRQCSFQL